MNKKLWIPAGIAGIAALYIAASSCSAIPKNASAVNNFEKEKYLGKWYEIARIDFRQERNLNNTTARYSLNDDGSIRVLNEGYNYKKNEWESATAKAKFRGEPTTGALKVSFFGPFYSGYNVIGIDDEYKYALVAGKNLDYLWILSRTKTIPENIKQEYLTIAQNAGYDTGRFIWVEHDKENPNH